MMTYLVIGLCIFLLLVVIFISAKPISMGIEARRNINDKSDTNEEVEDESIENYDKKIIENSISDEITKLNNLKNKGLLSDEEYKKAKEKILS
tara:strand:+ start:921 stop:1199 length:279 start_codon:yes stop_codon:yes gene_type:complete